MKQKEIIEFAMIGLIHEIRQTGISEEYRRELVKKHKELAYLFYLAAQEDK